MLQSDNPTIVLSLSAAHEGVALAQYELWLSVFITTADRFALKARVTASVRRQTFGWGTSSRLKARPSVGFQVPPRLQTYRGCLNAH
jgi:hypothetical protein